MNSRFALASWLVVLMLVGATVLDARTSMTGHEKKLMSEMTLLDKAAASPAGEQAVLTGLIKTFKTTKDRVSGLRAAKLGFGEIAATLAMADNMEGGLNEANVKQVAGLRQGNAGWVQIARVFDVDLGSVSRKVSSVEKDARAQIRRASGEATGRGVGGASVLDPAEGPGEQW